METRQCNQCKKSFNIEGFKLKRNGDHTKLCIRCNDLHKSAQTKSYNKKRLDPNSIVGSPISIIIGKIKLYHIEDDKKLRDYDMKDYITPEWVVSELERLSYKCSICKRDLKLSGYTRYDKSQMSVDRINNDSAHIYNNCRITCLNCNLYGSHHIVHNVGTQTI